MQPRSAHMQLGSENADGETKCVAIQGVHEAKPSAHAAWVGAHAAGLRKCRWRTECVAIQGVHGAKPSAHAASVGAHAHRRSKWRCRVECVAIQGVHGAKPSVHAASLGAHAARLRKCRWRNEVRNHTRCTRSQAECACSLSRRTCSWAQKMQMEN
jgi:hypothetical protein